MKEIEFRSRSEAYICFVWLRIENWRVEGHAGQFISEVVMRQLSKRHRSVRGMDRTWEFRS